MREEWAQDFREKATSYWTAERTRALVGSRRPAILPGDAPVLLRALGLLHRDGSMPPAQVRKYRQINHMVAVLQPSLRALRDRFSPVRLLDAACGRSYVSTLLAWHFRHNWQHPVEIVGVDRSEALVDESRRRAALVELDEVLRFEVASLDGLSVSAPLHGVLSLHGCDTATDDALALALAHRVDMVAVVPCCQAELSSGWARLTESGVSGDFAPAWAGPHLRRATAAHVTDLFRLLLLRGAGYEASAIEFVPSEHTPKNTLIRGLRRSDGNLGALREYVALRAATGGVGIALERRLPPDIEALFQSTIEE